MFSWHYDSVMFQHGHLPRTSKEFTTSTTGNHRDKKKASHGREMTPKSSNQEVQTWRTSPEVSL